MPPHLLQVLQSPVLHSQLLVVRHCSVYSRVAGTTHHQSRLQLIKGEAALLKLLVNVPETAMNSIPLVAAWHQCLQKAATVGCLM